MMNVSLKNVRTVKDKPNKDNGSVTRNFFISGDDERLGFYTIEFNSDNKALDEVRVYGFNIREEDQFIDCITVERIGLLSSPKEVKKFITQYLRNQQLTEYLVKYIYKDLNLKLGGTCNNTYSEYCQGITDKGYCLAHGFFKCPYEA